MLIKFDKKVSDTKSEPPQIINRLAILTKKTKTVIGLSKARKSN